jgi:hypothetical protein
MFYLSLISLILIGVLLMTMLTRAHPWIKAHQEGKVLKTVRLSVLQRLLIHQRTLLALVMGITLGLVLGWLPTSLAVFASVIAIAIVFLPMQYTFTTKGVSVGQAIFRPWKEFTGIVPRRNRVIMDHPSYLGRLTLFIKPAEIDSVLVQIHQSHR